MSEWRFFIAGGAAWLSELADQFGVPIERVSGSPWRPLDLHPLVVSAIDVGVVPLADTQFNQAKSCLKGLEYMALGIPFVASATEEYEWLWGLGAGVRPLASKSRAWRRQLVEFMRDEALRAELAEQGRRIVAERFLVSRNAWRWQEAWASVLEPSRVG
jgi:glycosyltransferase involved in cell wall biosynthesis